MVALFLRPDADLSDGAWTDEGGATTLFDAVDETSFSDTDYIKSSVTTGDKVSLRLSDPTGTPTEPMTIRVRCKREGTDATDLIGRLYEATSPLTLISYFEVAFVTDSFVTYEHELTATEFAAIGDFNNLYIEFESNPTASHHGAAIDLDFQNAAYYNSTTPTVNGTITDYLSISRASIGYAKTSSGTLTQFSSNTLRITNLGLLVEDSRTNILYPSIPDSTDWGTNRCSTTVNSTTAPNGTSTATLITEDTTTGTHFFSTNNTFTGAASTWTISAYLKAGTRTFGGIQLSITGGQGDLVLLINLTTGAITTQTASGTWSADSYSVETLADGWFRLIATATTSSANNLSAVGYVSLDGTTASYTGDSKTIYVWGVQIEQAAFPSSYIPTTTTSATRAADVVTHIGTLSTDIAAATGSIIAQIDNGKVSSVAANIVDSNGTNLLGFDATNHGLASISATLATSNTANRTTQDKLGIAWNASGRSLVLNGGTVATDATAQTPNSTQHLGSSGSANFAYAYCERLMVWISKLADATLQTLTMP